MRVIYAPRDSGHPMVSMFRSAPPKHRRIKPKPLFRESPRDRGYDSRWDRFSLSYRKKEPFCAICREKGRFVFCDVVDHKLPLRQGGEVLNPQNVWGLCTAHHSWKGRLEAYAEATGQVHLLAQWCDRPETRPHQGSLGGRP